MAELQTDYVAPDVVSEIDDDQIQENMLAHLPIDIDKSDGGFAHDFTRPAALEKAEMLVAINDAIMACFSPWSYGRYLDMHAAKAGLTRKNATYATTTLTVTGTAGTVIPEGFVWSTAGTAISSSIDFETTEETTLDSEGTASVPVKCTEAGKAGNVQADTITLMKTPLGTIESVTNEDAATGGTDAESDDDLRARIEEADLNPPSNTGCDADYVRWAKEVDGVGNVDVISQMHNGAYMEGTDVLLYIMDSNGDPATEALQTAVYNHIVSPDDPTKRLTPIGAVVAVDTCESVIINVSATVSVVDSTVTANDVKAAFATALESYMVQAKREGRVRLNRVGALLIGTGLVLDYSTMNVNSSPGDIVLAVNKYPKVGTITITAV